MSNIDDGGPAMPCPMGADWPECDRGLSLRDYFAAKALAGMLAYSHVNPTHGNWVENASPESVATAAYGYADAMLKARGAS